MASASAYLLNVKEDRREVLLKAEGSQFSDVLAAEPVPRFHHSSRAPLIVLASFEEGRLTHIGDARKGASAGTGLVRLNMTSLQPLDQPIAFSAISERVAGNIKPHLGRIIARGGLLPPKTMRAVVAALEVIDPQLSVRLSRLSASRAQQLAAISPRARQNLAFQKEALTTALAAAGVNVREVLDWTPATVEQTSFLDGLPGARVREDVMLHADISSLPGFSVLKDTPHIAARTFASNSNPQLRVTIIMANRLPLEEQSGADLIYYNETYRSFVLVQYKALEKGDEQPEFRWKDGDQFSSEIERMDRLIEELAKSGPDVDPDGYRLNTNPFFLKFCSRVVFNPDDKGMFPGLYFPHGLWKLMASSDRLKGPKGGNVLTYQNAGRRLNNSEFVTLVGGSWVGTTIGQSAQLENLIRSVLESGRTVTLAVKREPPQDGADVAVIEPLLGEGT